MEDNNLNIPDTGEKTKVTIRMPRPVHAFLKLKGMAADKPVEELVLEAVTNYFRIGENT